MAKKDKSHRAVPAIATDRLKAATAAVEALEQKFGAGAIARQGDKVRVNHPCIPTGIYQVDNVVIGAGGLPRARIIEIYGPEAGGKTTLTLQTIAEAQKLGELAGFIDAEHALDLDYAEALGVDVDNLYIAQPNSGEEALEIAETLVRSGAFGIVVIDSVAAMVPQAELDGDMGDSHMGLQARLMSQACRKLIGAVSKTNTCLVFINQIRDKIGVMFGSPETTTGGKALRFYASVRLDVRRIGTTKDGDEAVSNKTRIRGAKNKVGKPFREAEVELEFGKGFNKIGSVLEAGIDNGAVTKSGASYSLGEEKIGYGREKTIEALTENTELFDRVYAAVVAADQEEVAA